jgi:hypothetical protein
MNRNKKDTLRVYYLTNRAKIRAYQNGNLQYNYGITLSQYEEILVLQNGRCAGCQKHESEFKKALCVDHDHITGKIRGLLCVRCNRALGLCFDDTNILLNLIDYLKGAKP